MSRIVVKFEIEESDPGGGNRLPGRATIAKFEVETTREEAIRVYQWAVERLTNGDA